MMTDGGDALFLQEEETIREAMEHLSSGRFREAVASLPYEKLLGSYKKLLVQTRRLVNIGDLMQKDLNRLNEELRGANRLQAQLLTTAATGIFTVDSNHVIDRVSDALCSMTGFSKQELVGKAFSDLFMPASEDASSAFPCCPSEPVFSRECSIMGKEGRIVSALGNAAPVKGSSGEIVGGIVSVVDVTELMQAREAAEAADHAKSRFLATMSHEMRTPLNAISGFTEILLEEELTDEQRDALDSIKRCGDTLLVLINDILDLSKIEADKIELDHIPFSLENLIFEVSELHRPWAEKKGVQILCDIKDVPQQVMGDPTRLQQVLTNLMSNAIKFTDHGEILTTARTVARTDEQIRIEVNIHDTGPGIPLSAQESVFDLFSQVDGTSARKQGGTGLGLAISRRLVRLMGGDISVSSRLGEGSTFAFHVWLKTLGSQGLVEQEPVPVDEFQGKTVLIVGDDARSSRILQDMVRETGMECLWTGTGQEGLDLLSSRSVDLVIVEMQMPIMDGRGFAERVLKEHSDSRPPMVALSRYSSAARSGEITADLFEGRLVKPVRRRVLVSTIRKALHRGNAETRSAAGRTRDRSSIAGLRVLLAEDNPVSQKMTGLMLSRMGHETHIAEDGDSAVQMARSGIFDLVLMDIRLPKMSGLDAARALRAEGFAVPIVALTGSAMKGDRERCLEAGMDDYITKPIGGKTLQEIVSKHCRDQNSASRLKESPGQDEEDTTPAASVGDEDSRAPSAGRPTDRDPSGRIEELVRNLTSAVRRRSLTQIMELAATLAEAANSHGRHHVAAAANEVGRKVKQGDLQGMRAAVERLIESAEVEG
ncbi:MAG: response regulator [Desulfomonilaceae bacterium]|nr:response regulator [Desulfomonilaceae bacterium]